MIKTVKVIKNPTPFMMHYLGDSVETTELVSSMIVVWI